MKHLSMASGLIVSSQTRLVKPTFFGEENQNIQKLLLPKNKR